MTSETIVLPSRLETETVAPLDVTVITILRDGRHMLFTTQAREGDDPAALANVHALVRKHNFDGHVDRFVLVIGRESETIEAQR